MALRVTHLGEAILVVSVYASTDKSEREALFGVLRFHVAEFSGPVLMEGDFNCTLFFHLDRSYATAASHHDSRRCGGF